jgi:two-component sensor histidine kinase
MVKLMVICILFWPATPSFAQVPTNKPRSELILDLRKSSADTSRLEILLQLAHYYYSGLTDSTNHPDSALLYYQQARDLGTAIHSPKWKYEILCFIGKCYLKLGSLQQANEYFAEIENDIRHSGDANEQIRNWKTLAYHIPVLDSPGMSRIDCFDNMARLFALSRDTTSMIIVQQNIADAHMIQGKLDLAEAELQEVVASFKAIRYRFLHYPYAILSAVSNYKGNYNTAITYALLALENMRKTNDTGWVLNITVRLAYYYHELGQTEKSIEYFREIFARKFTNPIFFYSYRDAGVYVSELIKQKKEQEALSFIVSFSRQYPPTEYYGKASLARTMANCYRALGNEGLFQRYTREMIVLSPYLGRNNEIRGEVEYDIGKYLLDKKQYADAVDHFQKSLDEAQTINSAATIKDIQYMLFKVDSSTGDYISAIRHLNQYQQLKDSIFNVEKSRQIQDVQVKYESKKKEQDIQLLEKEGKLQQSRLLQAGYTRNWILGGVGLLLIIMALLAHNSRLKQRTNKKLEMQQKEIGEQNISLRHLVNEKDWLVKEIHHRVKNNFQTVMSLLGTQTVYLKDEAAIDAITDGQRRIHAMSLIHQKLYQTENMSAINMPDYVNELVDYLRDSFSIGNCVRFNLQIEQIDLDLSHCIPLGLILNESITNAIKYAFPNGREGSVFIALRHDREGQILLLIEDDGIGLPPEFVASKQDSMGIHLIRGLCTEIGAKLSIRSEHGTQIAISFPYDPDITITIQQIGLEPTYSV